MNNSAFIPNNEPHSACIRIPRPDDYIQKKLSNASGSTPVEDRIVPELKFNTYSKSRACELARVNKTDRDLPCSSNNVSSPNGFIERKGERKTSIFAYTHKGELDSTLNTESTLTRP
jgi:hypothetical protein